MSVLRLTLGVVLAVLGAPLLGWAEGPQFNGTCAQITWNANTESDLAGYRLYDRVSLANPPTLIATYGVQITAVSCASLGLNPGQHYLSLTAYDTSNNESAASIELPFVIVVSNAVTTLAVTTSNATDQALSWTEVDDGTGQPAKYYLRMATPSINWGAGSAIASGTCAGVVTGTTIGATKSCTITGLSTATRYEYQLVPYRGTLDIDAVFGPLSNIAFGTTGSAPPGATDRLVQASTNFPGADGPLGALWDDGYHTGISPILGLQIVSNRVRAAGVNDAAETYNNVTLPENAWAQMTIKTLTAGTYEAARLLLHCTAPPTFSCYEFLAVKDDAAKTSRIGLWQSGSLTELLTENATPWAANDVMRAEKRAGVLYLYRNDVEVLSIANAALTGGRAGIMIYSDPLANTEVTDFSLGIFGSAAAPDVCGCDNH